VVEIVVEEAAGRVPVIAGPAKQYAHVIKLARECERLGVDGLLSVSPYYNKRCRKGSINTSGQSPKRLLSDHCLQCAAAH